MDGSGSKDRVLHFTCISPSLRRTRRSRVLTFPATRRTVCWKNYIGSTLTSSQFTMTLSVFRGRYEGRGILRSSKDQCLELESPNDKSILGLAKSTPTGEHITATVLA